MSARRAGAPARCLVQVLSLSVLLSAGAALLAVPRARAAAFDVPGTHATLQLAVAAAAVSADQDNVITLSVSPLSTTTSVDIGAAFGPARHLVIRPAAPLVRASLVNTAPSVLVLNLSGAGNVTVQDLDILRDITNNQDIVMIDHCDDIVIERCRIGSNFASTGTPLRANVRLLYPTGVILRNNIFFARIPGTFDWAVNAGSFNDPANSLRLYNNVASDYRVYGYRIEAVIPGPLVLLRNNVAVNYTNLNPEPVAYRTEVADPGPTVITSHNVAYASAGFIQTGAAFTQDIAGFASSFETFTKADALAAFVTRLWTSGPPWDANGTIYHLTAGGPMHDGAEDFGMTVATAFSDIAVVDDIDKQFRPGGTPPHTDRGVDQLDPSPVSDVTVGPPVDEARWATTRWTSPGRLALDFRVPAGGRLEWRLVDAAGRLLHADGRDVTAEEQGRFTWQGGTHLGPSPLFYRLTLTTVGGEVRRLTGKVTG